MAYSRYFLGTVDPIEACPQPRYYLTVCPVHKASTNKGPLLGIQFSVTVDGLAISPVTLPAELCFTLVFDDQETHAVSVTHTSTGFTGTNSAKPVAKGTRTTVSLAKPWELIVQVNEQWPGEVVKPLAKAKVSIAGVVTAASPEGLIARAARALGDPCRLELGVQGLPADLCRVTTSTVFPRSADGFLVDKDVETTEVADKAINVRANRAGTITTVTFVMTVAVIKPEMTCDPIVLLDRGYKDFNTTASKLTLKATSTALPKAAELADLKAVLTYDGKIKCLKGAEAYGSGTEMEFAKPPVELWVKGLAAGTSKPVFKLSSAREEVDRYWRFESAEIEGELLVEPLEFVLWQYREGQDSDALAPGPKPLTRQLHNQNGSGSFTSARLDIKAPSEEFWTKGGVLTLTPSAKMSVFKDDTLTTAVAELKKEDFIAASLRVWVKGGGVAGLGAVPAFDWTNWTSEPEKVLDKTQSVTCGARIAGGKLLLNGDAVKLETFSLDDYLDRKTRNDCRKPIAACFDGKDLVDEPTYERLRDTDVAVAYAAAHKYYTKESQRRVNLNYSANGRAIFKPFLKAIRKDKDAGANLANQSVTGANWVATHLSTQHQIALHAATKEMIREYIERVLTRGDAVDLGFDLTRGVPGVHAEVLAVNDIFNGVVGIEPKDITVATYKLQEAGEQGNRFVACINCRGILLGGARKVRVITG